MFHFLILIFIFLTSFTNANAAPGSDDEEETTQNKKSDDKKKKKAKDLKEDSQKNPFHFPNAKITSENLMALTSQSFSNDNTIPQFISQVNQPELKEISKVSEDEKVEIFSLLQNYDSNIISLIFSYLDTNSLNKFLNTSKSNQLMVKYITHLRFDSKSKINRHQFLFLVSQCPNLSCFHFIKNRNLDFLKFFNLNLQKGFFPKIREIKINFDSSKKIEIDELIDNYMLGIANILTMREFDKLESLGFISNFHVFGVEDFFNRYRPGMIKNLKKITLSKTNIHDKGFKDLNVKNFPNLTQLDLTFSPICPCKKLHGLASCALYDDFMKGLSDFELTHLSIDSEFLSQSALDILAYHISSGKMNNLTSIKLQLLDNINFSNFFNTFRNCSIEKFPKISSFCIKLKSFTSEEKQSFFELLRSRSFSGLKSLEIEGCNLTHNDLDNLSCIIEDGKLSQVSLLSLSSYLDLDSSESSKQLLSSLALRDIPIQKLCLNHESVLVEKFKLDFQNFVNSKNSESLVVLNFMQNSKLSFKIDVFKVMTHFIGIMSCKTWPLLQEILLFRVRHITRFNSQVKENAFSDVILNLYYNEIEQFVYNPSSLDDFLSLFFQAVSQGVFPSVAEFMPDEFVHMSVVNFYFLIDLIEKDHFKNMKKFNFTIRKSPIVTFDNLEKIIKAGKLKNINVLYLNLEDLTNDDLEKVNVWIKKGYMSGLEKVLFFNDNSDHKSLIDVINSTLRL